MAQQNSNAVIRIEHLVGGMEELSVLSYWPLNKSGAFLARYNIEDLGSLLKRINLPIVFIQMKLYSRYKNIISQNVQYNPIYIFMENAIGSSLPFIYEEFNNGNYTIIEEENYAVLLVMKNKVILIQLIVKSTLQELEYIFDKKLANINFLDFKESGLESNKEIFVIVSNSFILHRYVSKFIDNI